VRHGLTAAAALRVEPGHRQLIRWQHAWPIVLRPTGADRVHLVHGAGGPLGGDRLSLSVDVAVHARMRVHSAGATLVQPGPDGTIDGDVARWDVTATVGGHLHWAPEPTIVTDGAALDSQLHVDVAAGGTAVVQEIVVLGRHGQRGGRHRGALTVTVAGTPLIAHVTRLDGADPALSGPGGSAGARATGSLLVAGLPGGCGAGERAGVRWAWTPLAGSGALLLAVGEPGAVTAVLAAEIDALDTTGAIAVPS
jgi:urease accessory protein